VRELKRKHSLLMQSDERGESNDASRSGTSANNSAANKAARQSKFTGFRHLHNKTMGGVTLIDGLRQGPTTLLKEKESGKEPERGLERPPQNARPPSAPTTTSPRVPPLPAFMTFAATMSGPSVQQQQLAQQASRDNRELTPLVYFPTKAADIKTEPSTVRVKMSENIPGRGKKSENSDRKLMRDSSTTSSRSSENGGNGGSSKGTSNGGMTTNSSSASDSSSPRSNSDN
jgi:hypothetical protein